MNLPKALTTVTPFSKYAALSLFIILPLITFAFGYSVGKNTHKTASYAANSIQTSYPSSTIIPSPQASPTPNVQSKENYKIYTNSRYYYTAQFPSSLAVTETINQLSALFDIDTDQLAAPGVPVEYVSVIPQGFNNNPQVYNRLSEEAIDSFYKLAFGETKNICPNDSEYCNYKRFPDMTVSGESALVVENPNVFGGYHRNRVVIIKRNSYVYLIGTYHSTDTDLDEFNQFLSTFRFTD